MGEAKEERTACRCPACGEPLVATPWRTEDDPPKCESGGLVRVIVEIGHGDGLEAFDADYVVGWDFSAIHGGPKSYTGFVREVDDCAQPVDGPLRWTYFPASGN